MSNDSFSNFTLGIIGFGNMGEALYNGVKESLKFQKILIADKHRKVENSYSNISLVSHSNYIILAVKPNIAGDVLCDIKEHITQDKILISIVAGLTTSHIADIIGDDKKIIRVMPNTPAMVNGGFSAICKGGKADDSDEMSVIEIFSSLGKAEHVDENKFDAVTALTGSSPAFIFQIIEAMSDAGVYMGLDRKTSINMSAQVLFGSGKMVLDTGKHPAELKDMVTSPAGTTIEGVYEMESSRVRAGIINAILASFEKSKSMSKKV